MLVSYCMGCASVREDNQLVFVWVVHMYHKITSVSNCMGCASVREDNH